MIVAYNISNAKLALSVSVMRGILCPDDMLVCISSSCFLLLFTPCKASRPVTKSVLLKHGGKPASPGLYLSSFYWGPMVVNETKVLATLTCGCNWMQVNMQLSVMNNVLFVLFVLFVQFVLLMLCVRYSAILLCMAVVFVVSLQLCVAVNIGSLS